VGVGAGHARAEFPGEMGALDPDKWAQWLRRTGPQLAVVTT